MVRKMLNKTEEFFEPFQEMFSKLKVTRVGDECICPIENAAEFIDGMSEKNIKIPCFSWWCYVSEGHKPCGMGGPRNVHGEGWYSEICADDAIFEFENNEEMKKFLLQEWSKSPNYRGCFTPAFLINSD